MCNIQFNFSVCKFTNLQKHKIMGENGKMGKWKNSMIALTIAVEHVAS